MEDNSTVRGVMKRSVMCVVCIGLLSAELSTVNTGLGR